MKSSKNLLVATILALISMSTQVWSEISTLQIGSQVPNMAISDQHEKPWGIPSGTKLVLFSASRGANTIAQSILSQKNAEYLSSKKTVYFSDLSKMPGFITRTFAPPSMRDLPYSIGIVLNADDSQIWTREEDAVTVVFLNQGQITKIEYVKTAESLQQILDSQ